MMNQLGQREQAVWACSLLVASLVLAAQLAGALEREQDVFCPSLLEGYVTVSHRPVDPVTTHPVPPPAMEQTTPAPAPADSDAQWRSQSTDLLVDAMVQIESGGNPRAVGRAGERGLMQIKQATWRQITRLGLGGTISFDRAFEPALNRQVGKLYLGELLRMIRSDRARGQADERSLLLAAYNAGPGALKRANYQLDRLPRSVRDYARRGSALHDQLLADATASLQLATVKGRNGRVKGI